MRDLHYAKDASGHKLFRSWSEWMKEPKTVPSIFFMMHGSDAWGPCLAHLI